MEKSISRINALYPKIYQALMFIGLPVLLVVIMGSYGVIAAGNLSNSVFSMLSLPIMIVYIADAWADGIVFGNFSGGAKAFYFNYFMSSKKGIDVLSDLVATDSSRRFFLCVFAVLTEIPYIFGSFYHQDSVDMIFRVQTLTEGQKTFKFAFIFTAMLVFASFAILTMVIWISRYFSLVWFGMIFASIGVIVLMGICMLAMISIQIMFTLSVVGTVFINRQFQKSVIMKGEKSYYD